MTDINSIDLKNTTLRIIGHAENSDGGPPVLWELSLRGQMLGLYGNHESVCNSMVLALSSDEHLYDLVNERCDVLRRKDDFTAALVDLQIESLHKSRFCELSMRHNQYTDKLVQFECHGLHWETVVSNRESCDDYFFCAADPYGRWVNGTSMLENSPNLYEDLVKAAVGAL